MIGSRIDCCAAMLGCLLVSVAALPAQEATEPAEKSWDLRPVWQEGQTSRYRVVTERASITQASGQERSTSMRVEADMNWKVTRPNPDGGGEVEMSVERISLKITGPNDQTLETTDRGGDEQLEDYHQFLQALVGPRMIVQVAADGTIASISGWEAVKNNGGAAGEQLTENDFQETAYELAPLAGGAADLLPGANWQQQFQWRHEIGPMDYDSRYELTGVEHLAGIPIGIINRTSRINVTPELPETADASSDVRITQAEETAQILFDFSRQEVVGQNIDRLLSIDITISVQGRSITLSRTETVNTQVLRIAEE